MKKIANNHHLLTLYWIVLVLFMYSLCRLLFYLINISFFPHIQFIDFLLIFIGGIRFDLSALIYTNCLFIFAQLIPFKFRKNKYYQTTFFYVFIITNSIGILANCIDFAYYKFTLKRTTVDVFTIIGKGEDFVNLLPQFLLDFWYVPILWISLVVCMIYLYRLPLKYKQSTSTSCKGWRFYSINSVILLVTGIISAYALRGGTQLRPFSIITAGQYASPQNIPIVLNTPFTILRTWDYNELEPIQYFSEATAKNIFNPLQSADTNGLNKKNVIIIILESFSKEYIGILNQSLDNSTYKGYTPFLDSLSKHSLVMTQCFANGRKSIEGIPAIISGIPSWMTNPFLTSIYAGNKINSPANLLKAYGYNSSFFHGGTNGTMGFYDYIKAVGFDNYFGRNEYNNDKDYDGHWGIYDEPFLQYMANTLSKTKEPFISYVFTLSSHHPYEVPLNLQHKFTSTIPPILKTIRYTDFALKQFFKTAQNQTWYNNTIFILTADHTFQSLHPHYANRIGSYAIPLIIYIPGSLTLKGINSNTCQQIDILPTIIDLLNIPQPLFALGSSVLRHSNHYSMSFINESWQFIQSGYAIEITGNKAISLYNIKKDSLLQNNLIKQNIRQSELLSIQAKAIIQTYTNRMIKNKLTKE